MRKTISNQTKVGLTPQKPTGQGPTTIRRSVITSNPLISTETQTNKPQASSIGTQTDTLPLPERAKHLLKRIIVFEKTQSVSYEKSPTSPNVASPGRLNNQRPVRLYFQSPRSPQIQRPVRPDIQSCLQIRPLSQYNQQSPVNQNILQTPASPNTQLQIGIESLEQCEHKLTIFKANKEDQISKLEEMIHKLESELQKSKKNLEESKIIQEEQAKEIAFLKKGNASQYKQIHNLERSIIDLLEDINRLQRKLTQARDELAVANGTSYSTFFYSDKTKTTHGKQPHTQFPYSSRR